ncbi:hypothetical protein [Actinoplanes sp. G11-F43]|uniref:hypothetical protein n=1 Tax=Actinoplanes sp. G11-F43 TaxID=3424130 RepID=UPI003D335494
MTLDKKRVCVLLLAVLATVVGTWAAAFPVSFHRDFPAPGWNWVSLLGPYNEHLVRDVGGLYLALAVLSVLTFRTPTVTLLRVTGGAWLIFNVEHWIWHVLHLDVFSIGHAIGNMVGLSVPLLLSVLLLAPDQKSGAGR